MSDLTWAATRTNTIDRFNGQTPRPKDEAPIIDVFEQHPALVLRAIDETEAALNAGKITWAWSILRARLERSTTAFRDATADTSSERTRRIRNAEAWIHNAGIHYDRQDQLKAELFGDDFATGRLQDLNLTAAQRTELVDHWREHRPRGIEAEAAHETWCATAKANHAILLERKGRTCKTNPSHSATNDSSESSDPGSSDAPSPASTPTHGPSTTRPTTSSPSSSATEPNAPSEPKEATRDSHGSTSNDPAEADINFDTNTRLTTSDHAATLTSGSTP